MTWTILLYFSTRAQQYADAIKPLLPECRLITCSTEAEAAAHVAEADILVTGRFPDELYRRATRLKWVQIAWAGIDHMLTVPLPDGCLLTRAEGLFGNRMSDYTMAQILAHSIQLPRMYANQAAHRWEHFEIGKLEGKRLGVAGTGSIGSEIARKGKAFGMEVWALVRSSRPVAHADRVFTTAEAGKFTAGVDYLASTLPNTPEAIGLIDPRNMKPGSLLINVGRGVTIPEDAILEAVRSGGIQAVLDVFVDEPLPPAHPFWSTPGITVTPHLSGFSVPAEVAVYFAANFRRFVAGEPLVGVVDRKRGY